MQAEAHRQFLARHADSPPDRTAAMAALTERVKKARDDFSGFQLIARAAFPELPDRFNLRATADTFEDLQRFINASHSGYAAAMRAPYTEKMSKRGYPPAKLETLLQEIDVLATLDTAHDIAEAHGTASDGSDAADTQDRDRTYVELKAFMKELKGVAESCFPQTARDAGEAGAVRGREMRDRGGQPSKFCHPERSESASESRRIFRPAAAKR